MNCHLMLMLKTGDAHLCRAEEQEEYGSCLLYAGWWGPYSEVQGRFEALG